jgi:hypothetical protein
VPDGAPPDAAMAPPHDAAAPPIAHAPPTTLSGRTLLPGVDVLDVSTDQGGGVWAATSAKIYFVPAGQTAPFGYDQASGLARGEYTWVDTWFQPGTYPVTFTSVAGGRSGEVVVGNIGAIADRLEIDPASGAVQRIDNMQVTPANTTAAEYPEHLKRVVAVWRVALDLNGTYEGTAYLGGWHGFYAFHGLVADCGCLAFEEHQHYITPTLIAGADVRGVAITSEGDVWTGDRDVVTLLPQRSHGPTVGLFDYNFAAAVDVWPNVRDEVTGVAVDGADGVWVSSSVNGLAYLAPTTQAPTYFTRADALPENQLSGVAVDGRGDVWVATQGAGVARYRPASGVWTYYTSASGLPSNTVRGIHVDTFAAAGAVYLATGSGILVYSGP